MLEEFAAAKVNLTLVVQGRRPDGYHELDSLVAFAQFGDQLTFTPGGPLSVTTHGPFASAMTDDNLVAKAARLAMAAAPQLTLGRFTLEKRLPVAAGLGGGSADAAAALRLLRRANPALSASVDWHALAARCGADVPVCLGAKAARMQGLGERLTVLADLPRLGCLLVNPRVHLATAAVFQALGASPLVDVPEAPFPDGFRTADDLVSFVRGGRNDLEAPAIALCPPIGDIKQVLAALPEALATRMSGSGPTCFALFPNLAAAVHAAHLLQTKRPQWWCAAAVLL